MTNAMCDNSVACLTLPERFPVNQGTSSGAAALARQSVTPTLVRRVLRFKVTGVSTRAEPRWLSAMEQGVSALLDLAQGWDSYGAPPISLEAIKAALAAIFSIAGDESMAPMIVPTSTGGCQLEWHSDMIDIEIEFAPTGESTLFMQERTSGRTWEGNLANHAEYVREFLTRLRGGA